MLNLLSAVSLYFVIKKRKHDTAPKNQPFLWFDHQAEEAEVWLKDKFGLSWQIIPEALPRLLSDPDPVVSQRAMAAMLQMNKIEIVKLT